MIKVVMSKRKSSLVISDINPPAWLSRDARAIWRKKCEQLAAANLPIASLDVSKLAAFCDLVAEVAKLIEDKEMKIADHQKFLCYIKLILNHSDRLVFNPLARATIKSKYYIEQEMEKNKK